MGDYSYVGDYCSIPHAVIGKYCSIGERCSIGGWQHDYSRITTSPRVYREILGKEYNAIAGGNPTRVIKYRFTEEKIQNLLENKWWEKDLYNDLKTEKT